MIGWVLRWLDVPPTWLAAFAGLAYTQSEWLPIFQFGSWSDWLAPLLIGGGVLSMLSAFWEMVRHRTTVIPRRDPRALVQSGIFRLTRNPIYLGDAMILGGLVLHWDAVLSLVLIPLFIAIIDRHFIRGEEVRIGEQFGQTFDEYRKRVRRWL